MKILLKEKIIVDWNASETKNKITKIKRKVIYGRSEFGKILKKKLFFYDKFVSIFLSILFYFQNQCFGCKITEFL